MITEEAQAGSHTGGKAGACPPAHETTFVLYVDRNYQMNWHQQLLCGIPPTDWHKRRSAV